MFKVKVTVVHNLVKLITVYQSCFRYHSYLCNQTRCVDAVLLITRPSANKVGYIKYCDNISDLYLGTQWGICCARWQTLFCKKQNERENQAILCVS